jgi:hypothetical protein
VRDALLIVDVIQACATADEQMERLALEYAERIVGAFVERS